MSWSGGNHVMRDLIRSLKTHNIDQYRRHDIYVDMVLSLRGLDWDGMWECEGLDISLDSALKELYGDES